MKVSVEQLPESRVQLGIEIDPERLEAELQRVTRRLGRNARIPGFRPGKAPAAIIERHYGREALIREALNDLVPDAYNEAIEAEDIDAIGQPDLEITQVDPPIVKATVPVRPTIDLGDYQSLRIEQEDASVTDEMVDEQLELLQRRNATYVPVERAAQWNDVLIADVKGTFQDDDGEEQTFLQDDSAEFQLREDQPLVLEGLAEAFIGMAAGDSNEIDLEVPDDFSSEDYRGRTIHFVLNVADVKEEQLPELDDDLAQLVNPDEFETLDDLKARIREDLQAQRERSVQAKLQEDAVNALAEQAGIEFPQVLVEHEIDHILNESVGNDAQAYRAHLQRIGRSEAEFRETFREAAEQRVRRSLVLSQLQADEDISVSDEEIDAEINEILERLGEQGEPLREQLLAEEGRGTVRQNLVRQRVLERLEAIVTGRGDEPAADEAEESEATSEEETRDDE